MHGGFLMKRKGIRVGISLYVICTILIGSFGNGLIFKNVQIAEAAEVAIDNTAQTLGTSHLQSGSQTVFIDDQTGYKFFRDAGGYCVYRKTTDGGGSWSATTTVDAQTDCEQIQVWYDRWTPGDTGAYIHIATLDSSVDDIFYNRLDTANSDTLLKGTSPVDVSTNSANSTATFAAGANTVSITKGTDGTLYTTLADATDSYVVECSVTCGTATNWTETAPNPLDLANDYSILAPLPGGDIMLINRDVSLEDIRYKIWNNSTWSASWTVIDDGAADNITYDVGMALAVSTTTPGNLYLAYVASSTALGTDDEVRTARYSGGTWTLTGDVITGTARGLTNVAIGLDSANDDVYVLYSGRTTPAISMTDNVYWKWATSSMMNWSTETGPINTLADDMYGLDINSASDQRIFATWFASSTDDIIGDTIADVFPGIHASTTNSQIASAFASTSGFYVGGSFLLYNTYKPINVTGITVTEGGTIDGSTNISNVKLFYESDTSAPYNCLSESYGGSESQFGSTDTNGFSGADGVSAFTGSTIEVSTTSAMCVYVVLDIRDSTASNATIDISIANPVTDITATGITGPAVSQNIAGLTTVSNDIPTQVHYHWRNDNGTEVTATSRTGGTEDTSLPALQQATSTRLRIGVSNEGSSSTPSMQYRLEYAQTSDACASAVGWTDVGAVGGDFDMYDTVNLTDGNDTTNIAVASGGVTDENTTFLTPNGGIKDTSSQTGGIVLSSTQYVDLEYSIFASTTATEGNTYCFRVTNAGVELNAYNQYPRVNIAADISVTIATSSQNATTTIPATNYYVGSAFVITDNVGAHNVTDITITEAGTIDAETDLANIKLYYDLDTTAPYDCGNAAYGGSEAQFGATDTDGFSGPNGTSTFTGSVAISTTSTMCLYTVLSTAGGAQNGETIDIVMETPSTNLVVSGGGSVSPTIDRNMNGSTTLVGAVMTQTHYHWRNDNGTEVTATSLSGGAEDTPIANVAQSTPVRVRLQVSNEGQVTSASTALRLEYGAKITTCSAVGSWTEVGTAGSAWNMATTTNLSDASDTTNIAVASGGVTDENVTFLSPNSAVKDASTTIATTTLTATQYIETEYSIKQTINAGYDTTYCFRLSNLGVPLDTYTQYPELTTSPERDFEIQRGTVTITGTSATLTAGVDYVAPVASTSAFIRITNIGMTGAGHNTGVTTAQTAANTTAYIVNPSDIMTSVTIARTGATDNTRVSWEIIEFIGAPGSDNEMVVRSQSRVTYGTTALIATGTPAAGVVDDTDVVVFITGQMNPLANSTTYNTGISTSEWAGATDEPVFKRGAQSNNAVATSYAVVEFKGQNWFVQRSEHTYTLAGTTETEAITAVNSLSRTFLHTQKRNATGLNGTDEFGHEVWLSSIGFVSYFLETGATTPSGQTSVAWIIENTQTTSGAMNVIRSNPSPNTGTAPLTVSVTLTETLSDLTNASIFSNARSTLTTTVHPRAQAGITIASTTAFEIWRSNTGSNLTVRAEIVEWPTAGLSIRQNHFQFFTDSNTLIPSDPWPPGGLTLGEDTAISGADEPLGEGDRVRIRMSLMAVNATFPAGTKAFKLQYGQMVTTCSAIGASSWTTLGDSASSTVWRGYNATGTSDGTVLSGNPPTGGDLLLLLSDIAGTFEEQNNTDVNHYAVPEGDEIEYDWLIEQNGANAETDYCFRMVESDGTVFGAYSSTYPQIRTASFTPKTQNWRWYDDEANITPTTTLSAENVTPVNIANGQAVKLRVTVKETENISRDDVRFKLQYSEYANFSVVDNVVATSTCTATSTWCYAEGGGIDNAKIASSTLTDSASCLAGVGNGCGTHNESPNVMTGFRHNAGVSAEYEFTIKSAGPRVNRVYYFRLYDTVQGIPVVTNTGEAYPSLATEGASLSFVMDGLASSTVIEGVTLDIDTTPSSLSFGSLAASSTLEGAHRLAVDTDGTEGYQLLMYMDGDLMSSSGSTIKPITGTNASPSSWAVGCSAESTSCFGYHTSDDTLDGGSTRFSAIDTYAQVNTTTPEIVSYSTQPAFGDTTDVIFRIIRRELQEAGIYEAHIRYISVPMF